EEAGRRRLAEVVRCYPDTQAAEDARKLLAGKEVDARELAARPKLPQGSRPTRRNCPRRRPSRQPMRRSRKTRFQRDLALRQGLVYDWSSSVKCPPSRSTALPYRWLAAAGSIWSTWTCSWLDSPSKFRSWLSRQAQPDLQTAAQAPRVAAP